MQIEQLILTTRLPALKRVMTGGGMELDIIANPKITDDGQAVIQVNCLIENQSTQFLIAGSLRPQRAQLSNTSTTPMASTFPVRVSCP